MKRKQLSLATKSAWTAQLFILPFYFGFLFFFLTPMVESLLMSFSDVAIDVNRGYNLTWIGLENYNDAFFKETNYTTNLVASVTELAWKVPAVLILSLVLAMIINQKFRGRVFVRAMFFLPVIFASGIILHYMSSDTVLGTVMGGSSVTGEAITTSSALTDLMVNAGFGSEIVSFVNTISSELTQLVWRSGVQMIIFLAGLQGISPSLYEASSIEGASAWENFWKITLPMLTPSILINTVFTIVDTFTDAGNQVMIQITNLIAQSTAKMGLASAFAWVYFLIIAAILGLIFLLFKLIEKKTA